MYSTKSVLPNEPITMLIYTFDQYFNTKVMNIIKSLSIQLNEPYNQPLYSLSSFTLTPTTTIEKLLNAVNTFSELDPPFDIKLIYHIYLASYYQEIIETHSTHAFFQFI